MLYDRPVNLFVGGFIGSPAMNMVEATVEKRNGGVAVKIGDQSLALDDAALADQGAVRSFEGRKVILGIRPENLEEASIARDSPADRRLRGNVELREALGSELMVHFTVDGARAAQTQETKELARDVGDPGESGIGGSDALFVGRFGARARVKEKETVEVAVDTSALHFFDPETGLGIYDQTKGAPS
jgi:multiple sugar transport system ATP-binding protein